MGMSRGNNIEIQGWEKMELRPDMKFRGTLVALAERANEEGVPERDRSPTSISSSATQLSASCWRELQRSAATKTGALLGSCSVAGSPEKQSFDCLPMVSFQSSRKARAALQ